MHCVPGAPGPPALAVPGPRENPCLGGWGGRQGRFQDHDSLPGPFFDPVFWDAFRTRFLDPGLLDFLHLFS